jgi:flavin reductase (DIM6/NTAB) family NADH-FMN oxidoreductase RutF
MKFDFESLTEEARYKLMLATVLPRPIPWVTTQDANGLVNAAPFSFFNAFGTEPATLGIGVGRNSPTQPKDTALNIRATEEFVVNLVPYSARREDACEFDAVCIACQRGIGDRPRNRLQRTGCSAAHYRKPGLLRM